MVPSRSPRLVAGRSVKVDPNCISFSHSTTGAAASEPHRQASQGHAPREEPPTGRGESSHPSPSITSRRVGGRQASPCVPPGARCVDTRRRDPGAHRVLQRTSVTSATSERHTPPTQLNSDPWAVLMGPNSVIL